MATEPPPTPLPPAVAASPASTETPDGLLRAANDARRARRLDDAIRGYEDLQARFPASREALVSRLSLGNLALSRGAFATALAAFDAYFASGATDLDEEALIGKARALAGLGRADEEREAWRALETRHPSSEYRWRARQRAAWSRRRARSVTGARGICRLGALLVVVLAATAPGVVAHAASAPAAPATCSHLRLVDADAGARELLTRVGDVVSEDLPELDVGMASAFSASSLFRLDDPQAGCLSAWIVIEPSRALIRVAGPRRCRFVFREVGVEHPLSELDRERVAQVAKAAIAAFSATDAADCTQPAAPIDVRPAPAPLQASPADSVARTEETTRRSLLPDWSRVVLGGSYGGEIRAGALWAGPGVTLALAGSSWRDDPELWVDLRYAFAHEWLEPGTMVQTMAGRAGVSVSWVRYVRIGLGLGADREQWTWTLDAKSPATNAAIWRPAARLFTRIESPRWKGLSLAATVFLDAVHSPDPVNTLRPGLALEVSWRSL